MHPENVRVLLDGRGELVGDFGAFERRKALSWKDRSTDVRALIGDLHWPRDPSAIKDEMRYNTLSDKEAAHLEPLIEQRLQPANGRDLGAEIKVELGLAPDPTVHSP